MKTMWIVGLALAFVLAVVADKLALIHRRRRWERSVREREK